MTTPTSDYQKPLPRPTGDTQPFWEFCKKHELRFQRCSKCGTYRHYPRPLCAECGSFDYEWAQVAPKGTVHTWVTAHRAFHPGFKEDLPLPIVIVDVDEAPGVRMMGNFNDGTKHEDLAVGAPVTIVFDDVTEEWTLPKFASA
ncbi:MAG: OB-fold domain-containing protein [Dehalococcoidia bacterium]